MEMQLLASGVLLISILTSLTTEAIKKLLSEENRCYNLIALITSCILSTSVCVGYIILYDIIFTAKILVIIIGMVYMSFLCSTLGYDKVKQTINQLIK